MFTFTGWRGVSLTATAVVRGRGRIGGKEEQEQSAPGRRAGEKLISGRGECPPWPRSRRDGEWAGRWSAAAAAVVVFFFVVVAPPEEIERPRSW